jgi:hypothetical protein
MTERFAAKNATRPAAIADAAVGEKLLSFETSYPAVAKTATE